LPLAICFAFIKLHNQRHYREFFEEKQQTIDLVAIEISLFVEGENDWEIKKQFYIISYCARQICLMRSHLPLAY